MKKLLSVILTIVMLAQTATFAAPSAVDVVDNSFEETVPAEFSRTAELFAYTGTCGKNLTWTLDDEGTLTIDGTGDMYDYAVKWIDVELSDGSRCLVDADKTYMEFIHHDGSYSLLEPTKTYEEVTLSDGSTCLIESGRTYEEIELSDGSVHMVPSGGTYVEVILSDGSYAVKEVVPWSGYEVKKIVISENVTDISAGIFSNVPFEVDEENTAFTSDEHGVLYNKSKTILYSVPLDVVSYEMPDSVTEIGNYAFSYCENLEEIMLSNALQIIGKSAFEWCISLKSIIIPDSVTTIGECAFSSCCSLASVTGGNGLTTIGVEAFSYCEGLTSVVIPDSVITIGDRAFYECTELTSATIGNGVTTIGEEAFSCCYSLTNVTIGDSVESIGDGAFCCCILLTNITVQNRDAAFGYYVFDNCDKVTIYGYEGSTAETYAEENDIPFVNITSKYTITYNSNGGVGAISSQIKTHGTALTLSEVIPTREGYTFLGWSTSESGSVEYEAGAEYTVDSDVILYAVWEKLPEEEPDEDVKAFYTISEVTARAGDTVEVTVSLKTEETFKGVGIASVSYDEKVLTLDKATIADDIKNVTMAQNFDKSTMTFVAAAAEGVEGFDGKLCTLTFIINEEVLADEYGITGEANTTYGNEIIKSFVYAGKVVVTDQVLGDINLDDYVNSDDAILLLQNVLFPKLYPISYKGSVDFNKDGSVNTDDAIRLLQHAMFPSLYPID